MAYNVANWGSINANTGPITVSYTLGGNKGAQFAEGDPQNSGAYLISSNHGIDNNNGSIVYSFQLTNIGGQATSYTLAGGALS
jgi:hypothetical protein